MRERRVTIHVGFHKTGTTTIQNALFTNREKLGEHAIGYWEIGANHSVPFVTIFRRLGGGSATPLAANVQQNPDIGSAIHGELSLEKQLQSFVDDARFDRLLISGEGISNLAKPVLTVMRQWLRARNLSPDILVYVRNPYDSLASWMQQKLKRGQTLEQLFENPRLQSSHLRIPKFESIFGEKAVRIRLFEKNWREQSDLVADFCSAIGIDGKSLRYDKARKMNRAMSREAAMLLNALNHRLPAMVDNRENPDRSAGVVASILRRAGDPFILPEEIVDRFVPHLESEIDWLTQRLGYRPYERPQPPAGVRPVRLEERRAFEAEALRINREVKPPSAD